MSGILLSRNDAIQHALILSEALKETSQVFKDSKKAIGVTLKDCLLHQGCSFLEAHQCHG